MALNKTALASAIKQALDVQAAKADPADDPQVSRQQLASGIADAIDVYIKGATIQAGPAEIVAATMNAGGYPVSGSGFLNSVIS